MLEQISRLAVGLADLAEAEGRVLREHLDRLLQRVVLVLVAAFVAFAGLTVLLIGVYVRLAEEMGRAWAAILLGLAMILLGGVLFSIAAAFRGSLPTKKK
ncbi:MAG: phage holin family protein [Planctomycetota bacterium]